MSCKEGKPIIDIPENKRICGFMRTDYNPLFVATLIIKSIPGNPYGIDIRDIPTSQNTILLTSNEGLKVVGTVLESPFIKTFEALHTGDIPCLDMEGDLERLGYPERLKGLLMRAFLTNKAKQVSEETPYTQVSEYAKIAEELKNQYTELSPAGERYLIAQEVARVLTPSEPVLLYASLPTELALTTMLHQESIKLKWSKQSTQQERDIIFSHYPAPGSQTKVSQQG